MTSFGWFSRDCKLTGEMLSIPYYGWPRSLPVISDEALKLMDCNNLKHHLLINSAARCYLFFRVQ